jgi:hypothetical protein
MEETILTAGEGEVVGCRKDGGAAGCWLAAAAATAVGLRLTIKAEDKVGH